MALWDLKEGRKEPTAEQSGNRSRNDGAWLSNKEMALFSGEGSLLLLFRLRVIRLFRGPFASKWARTIKNTVVNKTISCFQWLLRLNVIYNPGGGVPGV